MQADLRVERELLAVGSEHLLWCLLELVAPPARPCAERRPVSVALVLDRSGSMAGRKLAVMRACARFLVERLAPADRLAIVTYDDEVELRAPLSPVGEHRGMLLAAIERIHAGGSTNLAGGYLKGLEALSHAPAGSVRRVLVCSDGLANVDATTPDALLSAAERAFRTHGITTSTIGLGPDFDEDLLTALADAGGGTAHLAESPDDAPAIFGSEFAELVSVVAEDVQVAIRPEPPVSTVEVLTDVPAVPVEGGTLVRLGAVFGEERRRLVFGLRVPVLRVVGPRRIAEVVIRAVGPFPSEERIPVVVNLVPPEEAVGPASDPRVRDEVLILSAARAGERARALADAGDLEGARRALEEAALMLERAAPGSPRAQELLEHAEFWSARAYALAEGADDALERKRLVYRSREARRRGRRTREP